MLALTLLLVGGALSLYCLYQLRRWMAEAESATADRPKRLEALVDELVATAETTVAVVAEKAEALAGVIARADDRLTRLEAAVKDEIQSPLPAAPSRAPEAVAATPAPAPAPAPEPDLPPLHRAVYAEADAGRDLTSIARRLGVTKGEVELILGLRQPVGGGERP